MQLAIDVQLPEAFGGAEGEAVYIGEVKLSWRPGLTYVLPGLPCGRGEPLCMQWSSTCKAWGHLPALFQGSQLSPARNVLLPACFSLLQTRRLSLGPAAITAPCPRLLLTIPTPHSST